MIKNFDCKQYEKEYDEIRLSQTEKNIIKANMNLVADGILKKTNKHNFSFNIKIIQAVAAVVLVAVICTLIYISPDFSGNSKNYFTIVANAAEDSTTSTNIKEIYSGISTSGYMSDDKAPNKQGKYDFFSSFDITDFRIKGHNIKSITVKSNKNFCYFFLDYQTDLTKFSNCNTLENSQYTSRELANFGKFGQLCCDGFTYTVEPSENEQLIQLGGLFSYMLETDRTDNEIDSYLTEYESLETPKYEIRQKRHKEYGDDVAIYLTDEEIEIENKQSLCTDKFIEKTLDGATIDIIVNYKDGTSAKTKIDVDYIVENSNGDIIFEAGTDYYNLNDCERKDCYPHIVFRYK